VEAIQLDDLLVPPPTSPAEPPAPAEPAAPAMEAPPVDEAGPQLLLDDIVVPPPGPTEPAAPPPAPEEIETLTLDLGEGELDGLSQQPAADADQGKSVSSADAATVVMHPAAPPEPPSSAPGLDSAALDETRTVATPSAQPSPEDSAVAETKIVEIVPSAAKKAEPPAQEKAGAPQATAASSTPAAEEPSQTPQRVLDERSERMFSEQLERGLRAFREGNYRQAVHFLSIAAAIHPENQEVREKLRAARERKRQQDSGASS